MFVVASVLLLLAVILFRIWCTKWKSWSIVVMGSKATGKTSLIQLIGGRRREPAKKRSWSCNRINKYNMAAQHCWEWSCPNVAPPTILSDKDRFLAKEATTQVEDEALHESGTAARNALALANMSLVLVETPAWVVPVSLSSRLAWRFFVNWLVHWRRSRIRCVIFLWKPPRITDTDVPNYKAARALATMHSVPLILVVTYADAYGKQSSDSVASFAKWQIDHQLSVHSMQDHSIRALIPSTHAHYFRQRALSCDALSVAIARLLVV